MIGIVRHLQIDDRRVLCGLAGVQLKTTDPKLVDCLNCRKCIRAARKRKRLAADTTPLPPLTGT
jgi:hypothetical protein